MTIENALRSHSKKYPMMKPCDAVKLIYQASFGAGHIISDAESARIYFDREINVTPLDESAPFYEEIGNGFYRYNLSSKALRENRDKVFDLFILSANETNKNKALFEDSLEVLKKLAEENVFSFSSDELLRYLEKYIEAGCPMVSHSETYRKNYRPAYRVIGILIREDK